MTTTHINGIRRISVTLGLAFSVWMVATSSGLAYSARAQQMCMGDAMRLCSSEIPNVSRIIACMRRNKANVSAGCRAVMEQEDPASRPKPVQAAPAEPKPPVAARIEQPAPPRPKPVVVAPVEQKPPATARTEQPAPVAPKPVVVAPIEHKPAAAPAVALPAPTETKPPQGEAFEQKTVAVPVEQTLRPRVNPFRHLAGHKPTAISILAWVAVTEAKLAATGEQKPTAAPPATIEPRSVQAVPVAPTPPATVPATIQSRPVQAPAVEQKSGVVAPAAVKPVPAARPVKVVQRKQKARQVTVASYTPREGRGYERYISMAAPIMSLIMSSW